MTTVEVFRSGAYESIDFRSFEIEFGISTLLVAPRAHVRISPRESITAGQAVRIQIDGDTKFEGTAESGGTKRQNAPMKVPLRHDAAELFNAKASITVTGPPTDEQVLNAALSNAGTEASFTISYAGSATTLANDYDVSNRPVTNIFRDMMDRTGRVWWVEPDTNTIHVDTKGGRGQWQALDANGDRFAVESFDTGSVETVRNDVTVVGTGDEQVVGTAEDTTSQSNYGVRSARVNVEYAITQAEADAIADSLIQADPVAEGSLRVGRNIGAIEDPQVNKTVDLTDAAKDISASALTIERQTVEQGTATLSVGGGIGESIAASNRAAKSDGDVTRPGSVYGSDRLVDTSITEAKLADLAVTTAKLQDNAVINGKLDDLSVSETKIQDDSIATPKLQAEAVTANEIEADTITAAEIAAGTITALEIAADTLTANEINTLDLASDELTVGTDAAAQIEFGTFDSGGITTLAMEPAGSTDFAWIGTGANPFQVAHFADLDVDSIEPLNGDDTADIGALNAFSSGHFYDIAMHGSSSGRPEVSPVNDQSGSVGSTGNAWQSMRAYTFIDASDGTVISDGGDPLAGLADGHGPPDHCTDGDGEGVDISALARTAWETCRAQQREIERQAERIDTLEERLSALEEQV